MKPLYNCPMEHNGNIIIGDESALFFHLHCDGPQQFRAKLTWENPLECCFTKTETLAGINTSHPLYGGEPVVLLVSDAKLRRQSERVKSRCCSVNPPGKSFYKLKDGFYLASPELVFACMGQFIPETQLAEIGTNLCGRYYIDRITEEIRGRSKLLTMPEALAAYLEKAGDVRGACKARKALRWVLPNSGSPAETKMALQFCMPKKKGGFALPFTHMNYDVSAGRLARMTEQNEFCVDFVEPNLHEGLEYDGSDYHQDASKDKRRRNALQALGWNVFAIDKTVLYDPDATVKAGRQIAKHMGIRLQFPSNWERCFVKLRTELDLPV